MKSFSHSGAQARLPVGPGLGVLDSLRGLTALYVVAYHAGTFLWLPQMNPRDASLAPWSAVLHDAFSFGPQAVLIFFLISGFCIHYRQARGMDSSTRQVGVHFGLRGYLWRRLRRLYPPLLLALAITAAFDSLGNQLNARYFVETGPVWASIPYALPTLIGNLLFQADLSVPAFGSDSPLWSLAYEFWFYALYPLVLLLSARLGTRAMIAVALATSVSALLGFRLAPGWVPTWPLQVLVTWVVWVGGALIAEAYVGRIRLPGLRLLAPLALVGLIVLARTVPYYVGAKGQGKDIVWGAAFGILLAWLLIAPPRRWVGGIDRLAQVVAPLGTISYSLYLVHVPMLRLLAAWWLSWHADLPDDPTLAVVGLLASVPFGAACWYLVERHFSSTKNTPVRTLSGDAEKPYTARGQEKGGTYVPPLVVHGQALSPPA